MPKNRKKIVKSSSIKPENDNTTNNFQFIRNKKHSFFADIKLHIDQNRRKIEAKFIKPLFI